MKTYGPRSSQYRAAVQRHEASWLLLIADLQGLLTTRRSIIGGDDYLTRHAQECVSILLKATSMVGIPAAERRLQRQGQGQSKRASTPV